MVKKARAFYEDATKNQLQTHSKSLSSNNTYLFDLAITRNDTQTIAKFFSLSKWSIARRSTCILGGCYKNQLQTHSKSLRSNNTYLFDLAITRSDTQTIAQFFF